MCLQKNKNKHVRAALRAELAIIAQDRALRVIADKFLQSLVQHAIDQC